VRRIDALFEIEQELSAPLLADLQAWLREQRAKLSRGNNVANAMDYLLKRRAAFAYCLEDGRICLSKRRGTRIAWRALGRKCWCTSSRMDPGEGCLWVYGIGEGGVVTFTVPAGDHRCAPSDEPPPPVSRPISHPAVLTDADRCSLNWPFASPVSISSRPAM
jgi:hypothetical protein